MSIADRVVESGQLKNNFIREGINGQKAMESELADALRLVLAIHEAYHTGVYQELVEACRDAADALINVASFAQALSVLEFIGKDTK